MQNLIGSLLKKLTKKIVPQNLRFSAGPARCHIKVQKSLVELIKNALKISEAQLESLNNRLQEGSMTVMYITDKEDPDTVLCCAVGLVYNSQNGEKILFLASFVTHEDYRKQGLGNHLLRNLKFICGENGINYVMFSSNEYSHNLFTKNFNLQTVEAGSEGQKILSTFDLGILVDSQGNDSINQKLYLAKV